MYKYKFQYPCILLNAMYNKSNVMQKANQHGFSYGHVDMYRIIGYWNLISFSIFNTIELFRFDVSNSNISEYYHKINLTF